MGDPFKITLDDGTNLYFPQENAQAAMDALNRKGVKYLDASTVRQGGASVVSEPDPTGPPVRQAADLPEQRITADKPGFWQQALDTLHAKTPAFERPDYVAQREATNDFGRGAAHGGTLGFADKPFGEANQSLAQRMGGDPYKMVEERSPVASTAGDVFGSLAIPVPGGPQAAVGAKLGARVLAGVGRAATQGVVGAGTGAARAYAEGKDVGDAATLGGALGAAGSAVVDAGSAGVKAISKYGGKALNAIADTARIQPYGIGGSDKQLSKIAERFGLENLPATLAAKIEELLPNDGRVLGRNRTESYAGLEAHTDKLGPEIGALREQAGGMGKGQEGLNKLIPDEWKAMRESLQSKLQGVSTRTAEGRAEAAALQKDLEAFDAHKPPKTLTGVADIKSEYQAAGHGGKMGTVEDRAAAQSAATMGSESKATLERLFTHAMDDTRIAHEAASNKFSQAALLRDQINPKAVREQLSTNAAGIGGAVVGALGGAALGAATGDNTGKGAVLGAGAGALGSTNTGTRNFMTQLLAQPKAMDTLANIARASGKSLDKLDLNALAKFIQESMGKAGGYAAQSD